MFVHSKNALLATPLDDHLVPMFAIHTRSTPAFNHMTSSIGVSFKHKPSWQLVLPDSSSSTAKVELEEKVTFVEGQGHIITFWVVQLCDVE